MDTQRGGPSLEVGRDGDSDGRPAPVDVDSALIGVSIRSKGVAPRVDDPSAPAFTFPSQGCVGKRAEED